MQQMINDQTHYNLMSINDVFSDKIVKEVENSKIYSILRVGRKLIFLMLISFDLWWNLVCVSLANRRKFSNLLSFLK